MKKAFLISLALVLLFGFVNAQVATKKTLGSSTAKETPVAKTTPAKKPTLTGYVGSLNELMFGREGKLTADEAKALVEKGQPLVLVVGKGKKAKAYFVYNGDGSYASKKLVALAANAEVKAWGKTSVRSGVNVIIIDNME